MYVYKITNAANNKVYIGQTIRPIDKRFSRHICDALSHRIDTHFARAIRKYGEQMFSVELIDTASSQDELNEKERYWIHKYNSCDGRFGYNETDAISKSGGNTYMSKTEDEMLVIREKLRNSKIGSKNGNSVRVKCLNIRAGEELLFDSVAACRIYFGEKTNRFITGRVTNKTRGLYKDEWAIAYADNEYCYDEKVNKRGTSILVKNLCDMSEEKYDSIRLACRTLGISRSMIGDNAKHGNNIFVINNYEITILD